MAKAEAPSDTDKASGGLTMKPHDLESMSVDELWSLYEQVSSVLARRIAAEKARLDQRLQQLGLTGATNKD
jgi:DNA-binding protein H-NS